MACHCISEKSWLQSRMLAKLFHKSKKVWEQSLGSHSKSHIGQNQTKTSPAYSHTTVLIVSSQYFRVPDCSRGEFTVM